MVVDVDGGLHIVVAAGAFVNVLTGVASPLQRVMSDGEAVAHLSLDVLQMSVLLGLIVAVPAGMVVEPFSLLLISFIISLINPSS